MTRKPLEIGSLDDFAPKRQDPAEPQHGNEPPARIETSGAGWSRREAPVEGQFTIRANLDTIARFKAMCRPAGGGRFTYGEMLERLMDQVNRK